MLSEVSLEQRLQHSPHWVEEAGERDDERLDGSQGAWSPPWLSQLGQLEEAGEGSPGPENSQSQLFSPLPPGILPGSLKLWLPPSSPLQALGLLGWC